MVPIQNEGTIKGGGRCRGALEGHEHGAVAGIISRPIVHLADGPLNESQGLQVSSPLVRHQAGEMKGIGALGIPLKNRIVEGGGELQTAGPMVGDGLL